MSKPWKHALSSAKKFGGKPEDYIKIHDWFDSTKQCLADVRHRAILHSAFGIFLAEQVFGHNITNSENKVISVRDIGEQHVLEDLGTIPTMQDWLAGLSIQPWMSRPDKRVEEMKLDDIKEEKAILKVGPLKIPLKKIQDEIEENKKTNPFQIPLFPIEPLPFQPRDRPFYPNKHDIMD